MNAVAEVTTANDPDLLFLKELAQIESPSYDAEASERVAALLEDRLTSIGGSVRIARTSSGANIIADFAGAGDPILLVGHIDTVWKSGTITHTLPWSEADGIIRGPGVYDMKGGIVVMCAALERLRGTKHSAVRIILNCDEEVGSPTTHDLITEAASGCRAAIGFESPHPDGALKVGRRGSTRIALRIQGRSAHAALNPEDGISAINELVDQLVRVREITQDPSLPSPVLCNPGVIAGGSMANVVPEQASAEIGLRFIDGETEGIVLSALRSLEPIREGAVITAETLSNRPAWKATDADEGFAARIASAGEQLGQSVEHRPAAGAGDTNLIGTLGIPTVDGFGPLGGGAHALSEHIVAETLGKRVDLLVAVLSEC